MPVSGLRRLVPAGFLAAFLAATSPCRAEDPPPAMGDPRPAADAPPAAPTAEQPAAPMKALTAAEAAPLLGRLKDALKAKTAEDAVAAVDALKGATHPDFEAALSRLLASPFSEAAAKAAEAIGARADPKAVAKTAGVLWKGYLLSANAKRPEVKGAIFAALGAAKAPLDAKQYDEAESLWRLATCAEALTGVALYFERFQTDKRPCRLLALWLDEPKATNVNDGTNPPASYWEARWKLWDKTKSAAVAALKAITGQRFDSTEEAKAWFKANPKFGFDW